MENIYFLMIIALAVLAAVDLVVGVSNDAVNFLNSAIGSKAITPKNIMIIASVGVLIGAVTSSGMMEVARKGIFVPSQFYFNEIMYIFMAVMITDILLLDIFNTLGMPTSTTVSIVFELLGAAVTMSLVKISKNDNQSIADIWSYINHEKAVLIIFGILLSVVIAFTVGAIVQFFSRVVYTFRLDQKKSYVNAIFGGLAITSITYFIFVKGLKGTPFYGDIEHLIDGNTLEILLIGAVVWSLISQLLISLFKVNILKVIIGVGTFSLAMAFSGNDLVNFVGVPIAAWNSFETWAASGVPDTEFSMGFLAKKVPANPMLLILAGTIMVITLWFSKKAKKVIETGVNLSRQGDGHEKFQPNPVSRGVVRFGILINNGFNFLIPKSTQSYINTRFERPVIHLSKEKSIEVPAFDMIRASINLVVAGILISVGTSLKLPLSTTYVTFMVAMGTSLADRAWGRESAVYRIAGVLSVIGGWFLTALVAFTFAAIVAFLINLGGPVMVAVLLLVVLLLMGKNYINHSKKEKELAAKKIIRKDNINSINGVINESTGHIVQVLNRVQKLYNNVVVNLADQNLDKLKKNDKHVTKLNEEIEQLRNDVFYFIKSLEKSSVEASQFYIMVLGYLEDISQSISYISKVSYKHVNNNHKPLNKEQIKDLKFIMKGLEDVLQEIIQILESHEFENISTTIEKKQTLLDNVSDSIEKQINRIRTVETSAKNTTLHLSIIMESKDLVNALINLSELYSDITAGIEK
ncbi:phosphate/sulfate permease [Wenyingzhuangia heitensis]|uniref:Phosphate transporter n=1 Tax=Wenyingzhuangia heitensis TaxID=1487859 RepID=A0ABX0UB13_9FLAO|nr:inorganic phosphate transporter [Wenyingzhuangia heitensis]NIJ44252.1 phosphate/sulfate permease [Wenyingzhuangia heitensis]